MISSKVLLLTVLTCAAPALAVQKPILYSEEKCAGISHVIEPNAKCTIVPANLKGKVSGAKVPEDIVCDFYNDDKCQDPLWISMEDPGVCSFSELEIKDKAVSVLCYDSTTI